MALVDHDLPAATEYVLMEIISMTKKWDSRDYLMITGVSVETNSLRVHFANGDIEQIDCTRLVPPRVDRVRWAESYVADDRLHVTVPAEPREVQISWSVIRGLTDPQFASHMAEHASAQARYVGVRLRELRKKRGLTQAQVAESASIEPANLSRIENGHFDVSTSTLWKVLGAMGYVPGDLAPEEVQASANMELAKS